jgi:DNA invertase Pin-like site-specific DNA recombinase
MARKTGASRLLITPRYETDNRAIVSARVSEGRDRGHERISEEVQLTKGRHLLAAKGLQEVWWFQEIGVSGDAGREALEDAIQRIERHEAAWLIAYTVDRLGRDFMDVAATVERITNAGGCVLIVDPLLDTSTDAGQLIIAILAQLAKAERIKITKRWDDAQLSAWERGVYPGVLCLGLRNPEKGEVIPTGQPQPQHVPAEVEAIRTVAKALLGTEGEPACSWPHAAQMMTDLIGRGGRRVAKENGGGWAPAWTPSGLKNLYANEQLIGRLEWGRMGKLHNTHEPILGLDEFKKINARVQSNGLKAGKVTHVAAGVLRCASCRYIMVAQRVKSAEGKRRMYVCRQPFCDGHPGKVYADEVDILLENLAFDAHRDLLSAIADGEVSQTRTVAEVLSDIKNAERRRDEFAPLLAQRPDNAAFLAALDSIEAEIAELEEERVGLENAMGGRNVGFLFAEVWESMEPWERNEHIKAVLDAVFVTPGEGRIDARLTTFAKGTYPRQLPSRGRSTPLSALLATDVEGEVRVAPAQRAEEAVL